MELQTRGMKKGLREAELKNSLQLLGLSEREQRYIMEHSGVTKLLFANHQCCYLNEYLTKTLKKNTSYNDLALVFQVTTKTIRRWINNGPMDPKPLGRHAALSDEIEIELIRMLIQKGDEGHGLTRRELLNFINDNYYYILTR